MAISKPINNVMARQLAQCEPVLEEILDLIVIILSYLPVKSVGRFKAVCKTWNAVIRKRSFIEMQLRRSKENALHAVYYSFILKPTIERPFSMHSIIAAWNGLFLQSSCFGGRGVSQELSINNPETQQRFYLPNDNGYMFNAETRFGVAYGPRCYDYKVYKIVPPSLLIDTFECRMYSSITRCWKSLSTPPGFPLYDLHVCINGTVYWQINRGREDYPGSILAIDEMENFHTFDTPELGSGWPYLIKLGYSLGLAVVVYKEVVDISRISIWVLENPLPTWSKKFETVIPLFPLELTVSAAAWGNRLLITTPRRFMIYYMDRKMWSLYMSTHADDTERSTFSGFITPSLLPCNVVTEEPSEAPSAA